MKRHFLSCILATALIGITPLRAESIEELRTKLAEATREIQMLKARLAQSETAVAAAKSGNKPPVPPSTILDGDHPVLTAYEFAALAADDSINFKQRLKGKAISVTGQVSRFADGVGRGFKVILEADGVQRDVVCNFYPPSDIRSSHTADDGGEMILEHAKNGSILLATVNEKVVITGFFGDKSRTHITLIDCVLQKQ